jgi:UDPglucose 6-dehydrogenase
MLAEICEKLPYGDVDVVTNALGMDTRIGRKYLTGALGYGGPCFPRDNVALSFIANEMGVDAKLAETTDTMNRGVAAKVVERLRPLIPENATVAVLGLSYKPFSHVTEESQALYIARALSKAGLRIVGFDPLAGEMALNELHGQIVVLNSLEEALKQAEAVLIATPDPAFKELTAENFRNGHAEVLVVDFWRLLKDKLTNQPNIKYIAFGHGDNDEANTKRLKELWGGTAKETFQAHGK